MNPTTPPGEPADGSGDGTTADSAADGRTEDSGDRRPNTVFQPWSSSFVRHAALWLVAAIVAGLFLERLTDSLAHRLAGIFQLIVVSLFLSFAIEPAVGWLARRGWRRGLATGLIFLIVALAVAGLLALLIPAVVTGTRQLITSLPAIVPSAHQVVWLMEFLTNWTCPSAIRTFTPPGWKLEELLNRDAEPEPV